MKKASILTFGCKVNQYDSISIHNTLIRNGYQIVNENRSIDLCLINTCTVTNVADQKARKVIRRISRKNPNAKIFVTGCYAESDREAIEEIPGVSLVFGNREKADLQKYLDLIPKPQKLLQIKPIVHDAIREHANFSVSINDSGDRTRGVVKIQDGCSAFCTYCIIPFVRGRMTSRRLPEIVAEVEQIAESGCKEIVVTGVHLASYGVDIKKEHSLADVLSAIDQIDGIERIRFSSIEPMNFPEDLADRMAELTKCQSHFHIPIQSGCDRILDRMHRRYTTDDFRQLTEKLRSLFPKVGITTDVMVGFPGETDQDFRESLDFVEEIGFSQLHVFRYSPRRNTPAVEFPDQVPQHVSADRSREMIELGKKLTQNFRENLIGDTAEVLIENRREGDRNWLSGFTGNYVRVLVDVCENQINEIIKVKLRSIEGDYLIGV